MIKKLLICIQKIEREARVSWLECVLKANRALSELNFLFHVNWKSKVTLRQCVQIWHANVTHTTPTSERTWDRLRAQRSVSAVRSGSLSFLWFSLFDKVPSTRENSANHCEQQTHIYTYIYIYIYNLYFYILKFIIYIISRPILWNHPRKNQNSSTYIPYQYAIRQ